MFSETLTPLLPQAVMYIETKTPLKLVIIFPKKVVNEDFFFKKFFQNLRLRVFTFFRYNMMTTSKTSTLTTSSVISQPM